MKPALHFPRFGKILLAAALVAMAGAGCVEIPVISSKSQPTATSARGQSEFARSPGQPINGEIDAIKAMTFLYGWATHKGDKKFGFGDNCDDEWSPWRPQMDTGRFKEYIENHEEYKGKMLEVCKVLAAHYTENGQQKFMLGTTAAFPEAAGGGGLNYQPPFIIGAAIFVKRDGQWTLEVEDKYITYGSLWGVDMKLQRIGPAKHGILLEEGLHAGAGCSGNSLSVIAPYGGGFKASELGSGDNCETGKWDYSAAFDKSSTGEYYDVVVSYMTTSGKKTVKKSQKMRFQNGEYKAAQKGSAKKRK